MARAVERKNGVPRRSLRRLALCALGLALVVALAALSYSPPPGVGDDAWISGLTSVAAWLAVLPFLWWAIARLRAARRGIAVSLPLFALLGIAGCAIHLPVMIALRKLAYAADGLTYGHVFAPNDLVREFGGWLLCAIGVTVAQRVLSRWPGNMFGAGRVLQVSDGSATHEVPIDAIEHIAAAGNYVEIAWGRNSLRTLLRTTTLEALAQDLGQDFVRIHRSRLVRGTAVRRIETDGTGDFTVELASGALLRGSRRYREALRVPADAME